VTIEPAGGRALAEQRVARGMTWQDRAAVAATAEDPDAQRDPRVLKFLAAANAPETKRKYRWGIALYQDFCELADRTDLPGTAQTAEAFAAWLAEREVRRGKNAGKKGLSPNTIRLALSAVRTFHEVMGENPPPLTLARKVIAGHENLRAAPGSGFTDNQGVPAIKLPMLRDMVAACPADKAAGLRDRAILTLGLALMARRHVLAGFDIGDVHWTGAGAEVFIKRDKTMKVGGRKAALPWFPDDLRDLCPLTNLRAWIRCLADHGISAPTEPLFRAVDKDDRIHGTPGWGGKRGLGIRSDPSIVELVVRRAAQRALLEEWEKLAGHSLRAGGVTEAYRAGADIVAIADHGGWARNSPVIFRYIRDVDMWERNPLLQMVAASTKLVGDTV
jgi:integrase